MTAALARIDTWPPPCAPKALRRAHLRALGDMLACAEGAIGLLARYDYAAASRALGYGAGRAAVGIALSAAVALLGGHPPRWRYPSRAARLAAKRARTQHDARRAQWEARGASA